MQLADLLGEQERLVSVEAGLARQLDAFLQRVSPPATG
jgi:hypothetical protein